MHPSSAPRPASQPRHAVIQIDTPARTAILPLGARIQTELAAWREAHGLLLVSVPHTTCALMLNEPEPELLDDLTRAVERLAPWRGEYRHNRGAEDNAAAHVRAGLIGAQVIVPVARGRLALGVWQDVLLVECDGPRPRRVDLRLLA